MFNKNDFRHPCKHRKLAGLAIIVALLLSLRVVLYFPQASVGERKRARKFTFCEKRRLAEGREKKGFPYWVLERLLLVRFCFWCGYSSMSVSTLSQFFFLTAFFSFFIYERSPEISTIYFVRQMRIFNYKIVQKCS